MYTYLIVLLLSLEVFAPVAKAQYLYPPITFVKRSEAVTLLLRRAGIPVDANATTEGRYADVIDGDWYVPYLVRGMEMGLIDADTHSGLLYPHRSVTRAEFLKMMTITFGTTTDLPHQYTDIPDDAWYRMYVGLSHKYNLFEAHREESALMPALRVSHIEAMHAIQRLQDAEPLLTARLHAQAKKSAQQSSTSAASKKNVPVEQSTVSPVHYAPQASSAVKPNEIKNAILKLVKAKKNPAERIKTAIIEAVNKEREAFNLHPLHENPYLERSAQRHAKDMSERQYFSHYTPEGFSYVDRIKAGGYVKSNPDVCHCSQTFNLDGNVLHQNLSSPTNNKQCHCNPRFSLGENIARGQFTPMEVVADWMASESHRRNILRKEFEEIGIGIFGDVWVQNFGSLRFD